MGYRRTGFRKIVIRKQIEILESMGVEFELGVNVGKDILHGNLKNNYDSLFIACGVQNQTTLGIKDEELLVSGLEFLRKARSWNG